MADDSPLAPLACESAGEELADGGFSPREGWVQTCMACESEMDNLDEDYCDRCWESGAAEEDWYEHAGDACPPG